MPTAAVERRRGHRPLRRRRASTSSHYAGASAHLIDGEDVADAGALIQPGSVAAVLVYEVLTVLPVIAAWESAGATLVSAGAVDVDDLDAALDAAEAKDNS